MFHSQTTDILINVGCLLAVLAAPVGLAISPLVSIGLLQLALLGQIYTRLPLPPRP